MKGESILDYKRIESYFLKHGFTINIRKIEKNKFLFEAIFFSKNEEVSRHQFYGINEYQIYLKAYGFLKRIISAKKYFDLPTTQRGVECC